MIANLTIDDSSTLHYTPLVKGTELGDIKLASVSLHIIELVHVDAITRVGHNIIEEGPCGVQRSSTHDHVANLVEIVLSEDRFELFI